MERLITTLRDALDTIDACGSINMDDARALLDEYESTGPNAAGSEFLAQCENRRDAAADPKTREYWHRLAGSVRKGITLL